MKLDSFVKVLSVYLVCATFFLTLPAQGWAMFLPAVDPSSPRQADMAVIQKKLESLVVKQRLADLGLSSQEAAERVAALSDQQVHQLAANLDSVQAGADGIDTLIFLLLVAVLVVVILQVTGHRVIIR